MLGIEQFVKALRAGEQSMLSTWHNIQDSKPHKEKDGRKEENLMQVRVLIIV
jgi:hypothetical protein